MVLSGLQQELHSFIWSDFPPYLPLDALCLSGIHTFYQLCDFINTLNAFPWGVRRKLLCVLDRDCIDKPKKVQPGEAVHLLGPLQEQEVTQRQRYL